MRDIHPRRPASPDRRPQAAPIVLDGRLPTGTEPVPDRGQDRQDAQWLRPLRVFLPVLPDLASPPEQVAAAYRAWLARSHHEDAV